MIKRQQEATITKLLKHFPSVAILGPRQVGKMTLAKSLARKLKTPSVYLDLELPGDQKRISDPEAYFEKHRKNCVVIDEIQRMPELFPVLRGIIDQYKKNGRFILLGSASPDLLKNSSETLAGRTVYKELTGFNYLEIQSKYSLNHHWLRGGFPKPFLTKSYEIAAEWYSSFIRTYVERDLPNLGLTPNPVLLSRFFSMLAHSHGQIWNASSFSKSLGISVPTVSLYSNFFENAFLIRKLLPYHSNAKKRIVKSPKIYLRDSGLLHHMSNISSHEQLLGHPIIGFSWEGYVIEQIISCSENKHEYYFYRTQDGTECDLIIARGNKPLASIEIKLTTAPEKTKSFTMAVQDLKTTKNFVIIPKSTESYPMDKHITVCGLEMFLKKYLPEIIS